MARSCSCSIESWNGEQADFHETQIRKARKKHRCGECGDLILPGEKYEDTKGKWDGDILTYKTCKVCMEIRDCFFCSWTYSSVWGDLQDNSTTLNLEGLDSISKEARDKFFREVDLFELE